MYLTNSEALDLFFFLIVATLVIVFIRKHYIRARRRRLMQEPIPSEWIEIIKKNAATYKYLPEELKKQLHGLINIFLDEKSFEGCGGLEITDEIRVTIAAQACILLLNRNTNHYPKLSFILVYPSAYVAEGVSSVGGNFVIKEPSARLGESWTRGSLVVAWDHAKQSTRDLHDGHNVVLHEFAHQLDQETGASNGVPILEQRSNYVPWARVLSQEYDHLRYEVSHHIKDVMDAYGATNPAEFFAVATETFFEKPKQMKKKHPELFRQLKNYYKLDPSEWFSG